jgi:argininosuccinate synthase
VKRIVLAYGGGVNDSIAVSWLAEKHRAEIVTVSMDLGRGGAMEDVRDRAVALGAARAHVFDLRDAFATECLLPALQAGALGEQRAERMKALGRSLMAKHLVEVARLEDATSVAHGCEGPDQLLMDASIRAVDSSIVIIAPAQTWKLTPAAKVEYARARGIPVPRSADAGAVPAADACSAADAPETAATVDVTFDAGVPIEINGVPMSLAELVESVGTMAGAHGIGRTPTDVPALVVLHAAHHALQEAVVPDDVLRLTPDLAASCADLLARGLWLTPARAALSSAVATIQADVTGRARVDLFKGDWRASVNEAMGQWGSGAMVSQ